MNRCLRNASVLVALLTLSLSQYSQALPTLTQYWQMDCSPNQPSKERFDDLRSAMNDATSAEDKGIATLKLACVTAAAERFAFEARLQEYNKDPKGQGPKLDTTKSNELVKQALKPLENAYQRKNTSAELLFYYGMALALTKDDWAVNRFDDVITDNEHSLYAPKATLALAEYYLDTKGAQASRDQYKSAKGSDNPFIKAYANYKLTWLDYLEASQAKKAAAQRSAIEAMAQVTKLKGGKRLEALAQRAMEDTLDMVKDLGDLNAAQTILKSVGAMDAYSQLVEDMAYIQLNRGQSQRAYQLFTLGLKESANNESAVRYEINLASLEAQQNKIKLLVERLKRMTSIYTQEDSPWVKNQNKKTQAETKKLIVQTIFDYATNLDSKGREANNQSYLTAAIELYRHFLASFPKSIYAYETKFYYGQLLFVRKSYDLASQQFIDMIETNPKGKHTKEALDFVVTSSQSGIEADKTKFQLAKPGHAKKETQLPNNRILYIKALDLFTEMRPNDSNTPAMNYAAATVLYDFGHYKKANQRYMKYIRKFPRHAFATNAAARILEYNRVQQPDQLSNAQNAIKKIPYLANHKELKELLKPAAKSN